MILISAVMSPAPCASYPGPPHCSQCPATALSLFPSPPVLPLPLLALLPAPPKFPGKGAQPTGARNNTSSTFLPMLGLYTQHPGLHPAAPQQCLTPLCQGPAGCVLGAPYSAKFNTSSKGCTANLPAVLLKTCVNCCTVPRAPFTEGGKKINCVFLALMVPHSWCWPTPFSNCFQTCSPSHCTLRESPPPGKGFLKQQLWFSH